MDEGGAHERSSAVSRSSSHRSASPDGGAVLDADRGRSTPSAKVAEFTSARDAQTREAERAGLRDLDQRTETLPGLSRQQRDRERVFPRGTPAELAHPRMERQLADPRLPRLPLSSRQKKARSKTRRTITDRLPQAQYDAQRQLVTDPARWQQVNDRLSDVVGDPDSLDPAEEQQVRRIDRSLQAYERANDRGHIVYANVQMPPAINRSNLLAFADNSFQPGDQIVFDRYTAAAHQLHEVEIADPAGRVAVFEIQTRRGAYLGGSDSVDNTGHLLPRSLRLTVTGVHELTYRRPDGTTGRRIAVQLKDLTQEGRLDNDHTR